MAKDRLTVAEQRILDIERRKSATNIQLLTSEQKRLEKKLSSRLPSDESLQRRQRSISDASDHRTTIWPEKSKMKSYESVHSPNLLLQPKSDDFERRFSSCSDEDISENPVLTSETESTGEEEQDDALKPIEKRRIQVPTVAIIPPDEDALLLDE